MKNLFLFRDSYDSKYILSKLDQQNFVQAIIIETGKDARLRKLNRTFKKASIFSFPFIFLNLFSLSLYSNWIKKSMYKRLGKFDYPKDKIKLVVADANQRNCLNFILNYKPDIIFIYGTAILEKKFINKFHYKILNIHEGIVPLYRNVHSDFWAYLKKDYTNAGISIFFVDPGIDSGDIVIQKKVGFTRTDSLIDLKVKNLEIIPSLIKQVITKNSKGKLDRKKQGTKNIGFHKTPKFINFVKLLVASH